MSYSWGNIESLYNIIISNIINSTEQRTADLWSQFIFMNSESKI